MKRGGRGGGGPLIWYSCIDRKLDVISYFVMHDIESLDMWQLLTQRVFSFIVTAVCDLHVALSFFWKALFFISLLRLHRLHSCDVQSTRYCIISLRLFLKIIFRDDLGWNFGVNILWWNTNLIHTLFCVHSLSFIFYYIYRQFFFKHQISYQTL